jgi:hypothetical protein
MIYLVSSCVMSYCCLHLYASPVVLLSGLAFSSIPYNTDLFALAVCSFILK